MSSPRLNETTCRKYHGQVERNEDSLESKYTYLHGKRFSASSLAIGENTDIIPIYAGNYQRFNFIENL